MNATSGLWTRNKNFPLSTPIVEIAREGGGRGSRTTAAAAAAPQHILLYYTACTCSVSRSFSPSFLLFFGPLALSPSRTLSTRSPFVRPCSPSRPPPSYPIQQELPSTLRTGVATALSLSLSLPRSAFGMCARLEGQEPTERPPSTRSLPPHVVCGLVCLPLPT